MILGLVKIKPKPMFTYYAYGNISDIQGKTLPIMDTSNGVFTCIVKKGGLVEVDVRDILDYELYKTPVDPFEFVEILITTLGTCRNSSPPN